MAKKISKNARAGQRAATSGGKNYVKVVKSMKDPVTGKYTYKQQMIHKDEVKAFFADKK